MTTAGKLLARLKNRYSKFWGKKATADKLLARLKNGLNIFKNLLPLLASRGLPLASTGRVLLAFVWNFMLHEIEI